MALREWSEKTHHDRDEAMHLAGKMFDVAEGEEKIEDVITNSDEQSLAEWGLLYSARIFGYPKEAVDAAVNSLPERGDYQQYYGPNWDDIRLTVLRRDSARCQQCGLAEHEHIEMYGRSLEIHHKTKFREFDGYEAANSLNNLVTLCLKCHRIREG